MKKEEKKKKRKAKKEVVEGYSFVVVVVNRFLLFCFYPPCQICPDHCGCHINVVMDWSAIVRAFVLLRYVWPHLLEDCTHYCIFATFHKLQSLGFALVCCCCRFPLPSLLQSYTSVVQLRVCGQRTKRSLWCALLS